MTLDTTLGIAGVLISGYSLFQSKNAVQIAKNARAEVRKNRQTSDLSRLSGCLEITIQEVKIFGPVTPTEKLRGIDHHKVAEKIQTFILMLKDCLGQFKSAERKRATKLCKDITALLADFGDENKSIHDLKDAGQKILDELSNFSSGLKASLNKRIEKD